MNSKGNLRIAVIVFKRKKYQTRRIWHVNHTKLEVDLLYLFYKTFYFDYSYFPSKAMPACDCN